MTKPGVTLQPSKGVLTQAAAQIYSAYVVAGCCKADETEEWLKKSIREAIAIARTIDASVVSDKELPEEATEMVRIPPVET